MKDKKMIILLGIIVFLFLTILGIRVVYDLQQDIKDLGNIIENNEETD